MPPIDSTDSLRAEILRLRGAIDHASCSDLEKSFGDARNSVTSLLQESYGGSCVLYVLSCAALPFLTCFSFYLIYQSAVFLNEKLMRHRLKRELCVCPLLQEELQNRTLTQFSRRAANGRLRVVLTLKCLIAAVVLLGFMSSRLLMEAAVRRWLRAFLPIPDLDADLLGFLSGNGLRELQSLLVFSTVGSGVMAVGLRLLHSASVEAAGMHTGAAASLQLLQKIDDTHTARAQEDMKRQLAELTALVTECIAHTPKLLDELEDEPNGTGDEIQGESLVTNEKVSEDESDAGRGKREKSPMRRQNTAPVEEEEEAVAAVAEETEEVERKEKKEVEVKKVEEKTKMEKKAQ